MQIDNISWYENKLVLEDIQKFPYNDSNFLRTPPIRFSHRGSAALFNLTKWTPGLTISPPSDFSGQKIVIVRILREEDGQQLGCEGLNRTIFGNPSRLPDNVVSLESECVGFGTINFTAGIVISPQSKYLSTKVVEAMNPEHIVTGYWVTDALYMISNIVMAVLISNATAA
jgi:hypothetical protein